MMEDILDDLCELRAEKSWWKDETRCGYADKYESLDRRIQNIHSLLSGEPLQTPQPTKE